MKCNWEIGKRYKPIPGTGALLPQLIVECRGFTTTGSPIAEYLDNGHICNIAYPSKWEEYKEPTQGICSIYIYQKTSDPTHFFSSSDPHCKQEAINWPGYKMIAKLEIPWREGEGLDK